MLAIIAFLAIGPVVTGLSKALASGVQVIVDAGLLPLASILVEPAKMLFLNNAINHGIFSPIGLEESVRTGKSIFSSWRQIQGLAWESYWHIGWQGAATPSSRRQVRLSFTFSVVFTKFTSLTS